MSNEYLTTSSIDCKHVWNKKMDETKINEPIAIAKYNCTFHKVLFGKSKDNNPNNNTYSTAEWKHFSGDWKLFEVNAIMSKQRKNEFTFLNFWLPVLMVIRELPGLPGYFEMLEAICILCTNFYHFPSNLL